MSLRDLIDAIKAWEALTPHLRFDNRRRCTCGHLRAAHYRYRRRSFEDLASGCRAVFCVQGVGPYHDVAESKCPKFRPRWADVFHLHAQE